MKYVSVLLLAMVVAPFVTAQSSFINGVTHDGVSLAADLPGSQQFKNIGSKVDGAGMCVTSSIEMAALWAGLEQMRGFRNWCAQYPGGGYPQKVDQLLAKYFKQKNITPIPYLQYEGRSPQALLSLISKTGRMACFTYGYSPRYSGRIAHMVCGPLYGDKYAVVLDNNFPGENKYEWMTPAELVKRINYPSGSGWVFVWLPPSPPPSPRNKGTK